jgi:hypothetical protein
MDQHRAQPPKTGEKVKIKPKKPPFFKVGKELKARADRKGILAVSVVVSDRQLIEIISTKCFHQ